MSSLPDFPPPPLPAQFIRLPRAPMSVVVRSPSVYKARVHCPCHVVKLNIAQHGSDVPPHRSHHLNLPLMNRCVVRRPLCTNPTQVPPTLPARCLAQLRQHMSLARSPFVTLLFLTLLSTKHGFFHPNARSHANGLSRDFAPARDHLTPVLAITPCTPNTFTPHNSSRQAAAAALPRV